jgi:transcriptional regulator with XRE-family HTH domain
MGFSVRKRLNTRNYPPGNCRPACLCSNDFMNQATHAAPRPSHEAPQALPHTLAQARKARRISQLELALRMGVSQRHVSFVESGRAKPSRTLLMAWLHELGAPLALRNAALLQAGFAPAFGEAPLTEPSLAPATEALAQLLQAHNPQPALVLDAQWNVLQLNNGALWLAKLLMPELLAQLQAAGGTLNFLDALCHPQGFTRQLSNMEEVGPALLMHLRDEAWVQPSLAPKTEAFAALLKERLGASSATHTAAALVATRAQTLAPVLTSRFQTAHGELCFFSMFSTFGTPQNINLASLRVEHMFAADAHTHEVLAREVGDASGQ